MIGLDTNVLLRLLLRDEPDQLRRAEGLVRADGGRATVNELVVAETAWTLSRKPGADQREVEARLAALLSGRRLTALDPKVLSLAAAESVAHGFGLADGLIAARNRAAGCETTYTFDRRAARSDLFTLVPA